MEHMFIMSPAALFQLSSTGCLDQIGTHHLVLPHLYDTVVNYTNIYRDLSIRGHFLMQDNSIFELKNVVAGDLVDFARNIGAHEIVVPEVLRDASDSIQAKEEFFASLSKETINSFLWAAVVQGKDYAECRFHYMHLMDDERISTVCIPFNYEFDALGQTDEKRRQQGWNRFSFVYRLVNEGGWRIDRTHHLLGLYNPAELSQYYTHFGYKVQKSIRSNDSSSCFWHSLHGVHYFSDCGLLYCKIESTVDFNEAFTKDVQRSLFLKNAHLLKGFAKGFLNATSVTAQYKYWIGEMK